MNLYFNLILSTIAVAFLFSCNKKSDQDSHITLVSASGIAASNLTASEKAEEYAKSAETLLTAQGFTQAYELANLALAQDKNNLRAGFIRGMVSVLILQKGILDRVQPLADSHPELKKSRELRHKEIKDQEKTNFNQFFIGGKADIKNEADFQSDLDKTVKTIKDFRLFLKKNKDSELTIKANLEMMPDLIERYARSCEIKATANLEYELTCPSPESRYEVTLNRADFEMVAGQLAFLEIYFIILNSYDLSGGIKVSRNHHGKEEVPAQVVADELLQNNSFGTLRSTVKLTDVKSLGLDIVDTLNWSMQNQKVLCPKGTSSPTNRIGKLANQGLCITGAQRFIDIFREFVSGNSIESTSVKGETVYTAKATYGAIFTNPIKDLRSLGPFKFDKCQQLESVGDLTLGGIFPNKDANIVLPLVSPTCNK